MEKNSKDVKTKTKEGVITATSNRIFEILLSITHLYIFQHCSSLLFEETVQFLFSSLLSTANRKLAHHMAQHKECKLSSKEFKTLLLPLPKGESSSVTYYFIVQKSWQIMDNSEVLCYSWREPISLYKAQWSKFGL